MVLKVRIVITFGEWGRGVIRGEHKCFPHICPDSVPNNHQTWYFMWKLDNKHIPCWNIQSIEYLSWIHDPPPSSILERSFFSCVCVFVCVFPSFPLSNFILLPSLKLNTLVFLTYALLICPTCVYIFQGFYICVYVVYT